MKTMTVTEFQDAYRAQADKPERIVFKCPACGTLQSGEDFISAGAGKDFESVSADLGFSCIGRFTGKGSPSDEKGKGHGCNWTLGGLFRIHELEVIDQDGKVYPHFDLATKEEADAHRSAVGGKDDQAD